MLNPIKRAYQIYTDILPTQSDSPSSYSKIHDEYFGVSKIQKLNSEQPLNQLIKLDAQPFVSQALSTKLIEIRDKKISIKPEWHAPWKLSRVISGHIGAVRAVGKLYT